MTKRRMHDGCMWENPNFARLNFDERLLFCALIDTADDQGRMLANPAFVRSKTFPFDNIEAERIEAMLEKLASNESIKLYEAINLRCLQIVNWWKYQSPQWAQPSRLPPPEGWKDRIRHRLDPTTIVTFNWTTPSGKRVPDTCDSLGQPLNCDDEQNANSLANNTAKELDKRHVYGNGNGKGHGNGEAEADANASAEQPLAAPAADFGKVYQAVEDTLGELRPQASEQLKDYWRDDFAELTLEQWLDACRDCAEHNGRNLAYLRKCLITRRDGGTGPPGKGWYAEYQGAIQR